MRPTFKSLLIISLLILSAGGVSAQKKKVKKKNNDYVITPAGDTVFCVINVTLLGKSKYTTIDDGPNDLIPTEVKEYHINSKNENYRSVYRPGEKKPVFLKVVESGKIDLYVETEVNSFDGSKMPTWFIDKGTDKVIELRRFMLTLDTSQKAPKNTFVDMIKDNKDVYEAYTHDKKADFEQARSLIHMYNTGAWAQGQARAY